MNADRTAIRSSKLKSLWLVIPTLVFVVAVWLDLSPYLRGPAEWPPEWRWSLRPSEVSARTFAPLLVLALYVVVCAICLSKFRSESGRDRSPRLFLGFLTLAAPTIQLALAAGVVRLPLNEFFAPTISPLSSGYMSTALDVPDMNRFLADYPAIMTSLANHVQTHPPGPILLQWLGWKFFEASPSLADSIAMPLRTLQCHNPGLMALDNSQLASALVGMLLPVIGAFAVWPMYAVGKRTVGLPATLVAVSLFPIMPLFAMWPTQWDQLYPLLLFIGLYLMHVGLESRSLWRIFLAGIPLSIATFFSIGNSVLVAIVGVYGGVYYFSNLAAGRRLDSYLIKLGLSFGLGCASIWLVYALFYRVNPFDVFSIGSRLAWESTTGQRSYSLWLVWNPIDYAIFLGIPIVLLFVLNWRRLLRPSRRWLPLLVSTFGVFLLLDLVGIVRGEVGRLWMYFGPLMLLIASGVSEPESSANLSDEKPIRPWSAVNKTALLLSGLTALQLFTLNSRWLISDHYLGEPPERAANFIAPQPAYATHDVFDKQIALSGYDANSAADTLALTLYWQALAQPLHAYTVFVHVSDANGQAVGQQDNMPVHDQLPTSCWVTGEYVTDPYTIKLAEGARRPLTIDVGLYRGDSGARLPRSDASGDSVRLEVP